MNNSPKFHRLETWSPREPKRVTCSFKTDRFGYVQVQFTKYKERDKEEFDSLPNEPNLQMFSNIYKKQMEAKTRIVWRMVFDVPAMTDRFK